GTVTGSSYRLTDTQTGRGVLIDLGMFQGTEEITKMNYWAYAVDASQLDGVLLTHAHLDHCGRLPILIQMGYRGKIYMTEATRMLTELTLRDAAKIAKDNTDAPPLFNDSDVDAILSQVKIVYYHQEFQVGKFKVQYIDAGHILGSASIIITDPTAPIGFQTHVFSGDIGNYPEDLVRPTEFPTAADVVVMESTYGDRDHEPGDPIELLQKEINTIEETGGTLLIPAFALEKTQQLIHNLGHLKKDNKIKYETPVFVDSPMAIRATDIYKQFEDLYSEELADHAKKSNPFYFPGLQMVLKGNKSKKIKMIEGPKVIVAGGGMMTGGRIIQHAATYLSNKSSRLLFSGYQGEETLGREIEEGADTVLIKERPVAVNATIGKLNGMSSHADQPKLIEWLEHIKGVSKVFITHGEDTSRIGLKSKIQDVLNITDITMPKMNEEHKVE
ncbi:MAG: MBL fold metallo-hydrolase, partial [Patescibacteria group bacterium]